VQQFLDPLVIILVAAGVVTCFLQDWVDAGVIFGVVMLNAVVGYIQEAKAVAAIDALSKAMTTEATLIRAGEQLRLPATEIVPGDLVQLQAGDKVPADLRLLRSRELRVDESALTGESLPVEKRDERVARDCPLAERGDMAYASALVTFGTGAGLVVATGDATEVGKISRLIQEARDLKTPLTRKIDQFSKVLLIVIVGMALVTFAVGLLRGESVVEMFKASIALAVAAIPEGLPAAVTITLAIGVSRMARRRAIIRKLPAVETLGSTMVICTDKTGTLTQNQMTVQRVEAAAHRDAPAKSRRRRAPPPSKRCVPACSATTRLWSRRTVAGTWPATPRRPRYSPAPARPGWTAAPKKPPSRASTRSRSRASTSTWPRFTMPATDVERST
jgi:cation-transporting ATPase F